MWNICLCYLINHNNDIVHKINCHLVRWDPYCYFIQRFGDQSQYPWEFRMFLDFRENVLSILCDIIDYFAPSIFIDCLSCHTNNNAGEMSHHDTNYWKEWLYFLGILKRTLQNCGWKFKHSKDIIMHAAHRKQFFTVIL